MSLYMQSLDFLSSLYHMTYTHGWRFTFIVVGTTTKCPVQNWMNLLWQLWRLKVYTDPGWQGVDSGGALSPYSRKGQWKRPYNIYRFVWEKSWSSWIFIYVIFHHFLFFKFSLKDNQISPPKLCVYIWYMYPFILVFYNLAIVQFEMLSKHEF